MADFCKALASEASLNYIKRVLLCRWPIKTCSVGLAHQGPRCRMMFTSAGMNIKQDFLPFFRRDAPLEDTRFTVLVELSVMFGVCCSSATDALGFCLVLGELM